MNKNTTNNVTVNNYTCAIYASGMLVGHVEMTNTDIAKFNADNRGELYAKALLNRKEVKTEPELINGDERFRDLENDLPF
jgi:hypothetical protein